MAEIKIVGINEISKGSYILLDGRPCRVTDVSISRPGKHGHAKFRVVAVGLLDEKKREMVMPHGDVEVPIVEKKNAQVLSVMEGKANVMDSETYETFDLDIPNEFKDEIKEGVTVLFWEILDNKIIKQIKNK